MLDNLQEAKKAFGDEETYNRLLHLNLEEISGNPEDIEKVNNLIDRLERFVKKYADTITPSQLRNIYSAIKEKDDSEIGQLVLLRPKLAYISARQQKPKARIMTSFISDLISKVNDKASFKSFKTVMEALVAYHKLYHEDKSNSKKNGKQQK